ncbi:hypothetical protein E3N88_37676 [Mikania micrantha]|uniref:Uncharacterized protein n=1 Tax=Mikania micrantha TaxID=192012 RepID=A0A5N6LRW1_9ASTR|nr:hypothetical protein E3N88_37676 [Mikania micrantha]
MFNIQITNLALEFRDNRPGLISRDLTEDCGRDKFLSQGEKFEKMWKMNSISDLAKGKTTGLGYNSVEPPVVYTPQVEVKCKPEIKLVFDEELGVHMADSESEVSDNTSAEDTTEEEVVVPEIKTKTVSKRKNHK